MTTTTKRKLKRLITGIYRTYKTKVYAVALMMFSILPAIIKEDNSWLIIGVALCVTLYFSDDKAEEF